MALEGEMVDAAPTAAERRMIMAKKQNKPTKTCADCIHESACRGWTGGRCVSDVSASQCPNHQTVKESGAYLCGVLDERKRKKTNADCIRAMSDEELVNFLMRLMGHAQCFAEGIFPYHPCPQEQNCKQCGLDWLQQPSREEGKHEALD